MTDITSAEGQRAMAVLEAHAEDLRIELEAERESIDKARASMAAIRKRRTQVMNVVRESRKRGSLVRIQTLSADAIVSGERVSLPDADA